MIITIPEPVSPTMAKNSPFFTDKLNPLIPNPPLNSIYSDLLLDSNIFSFGSHENVAFLTWIAIGDDFT